MSALLRPGDASNRDDGCPNGRFRDPALWLEKVLGVPLVEFCWWREHRQVSRTDDNHQVQLTGQSVEGFGPLVDVGARVVVPVRNRQVHHSCAPSSEFTDGITEHHVLWLVGGVPRLATAAGSFHDAGGENVEWRR